MNVVIIGSGMSGLTAGAYLSRMGHKVEVFEQFHERGGVTATLRHKGFGWDLGPLLLEGWGAQDMGTKILKELGCPGGFVTPPRDRGIVFPDFSLWKPDEYEGPYWRRERLKRLFPEDAKGLDLYYEFYEKLMNLMVLGQRSDLQKGVERGITLLRMMLRFLPLKKMKDRSAADVVDSFFTRPELKAVFTGILADLVVKPSEFPGLGVPAFNIESAFDSRIPNNYAGVGSRPEYRFITKGCSTLVDAVGGVIEENGGVITVSAPVKKIIVEKNQAAGVVLNDGYRVDADCVIATGGAREVFYDLLGSEYLTPEYRQKIDGQVQMESVFMVHLGVNFDPCTFQKSALCYYYGTHDVEQAVQDCRNGTYHEGKEGFLIYVPSHHSPAMAPEGMHAVTVYTIAPNTLNGGNWNDRREELADKLILEAERYIPGLKKGTVERVILTPEDFQKRVHQRHHSFGGIAPVMGNENPSFRTPVNNLWFIGSQSESGGGVLGVMKGARKAAAMIDPRVKRLR